MESCQLLPDGSNSPMGGSGVGDDKEDYIDDANSTHALLTTTRRSAIIASDEEDGDDVEMVEFN